MPKNIALRYKDVNVGERYAIVTKNNGNNSIFYSRLT